MALFLFILAVLVFVGCLITIVSWGIIGGLPGLVISVMSIPFALILISITGVKVDLSSKYKETKSNIRFVRWYIAVPFLYILTVETIGLINKLRSGETITDSQFQSVLLTSGIVSLLVLPEILSLSLHITRSINKKL
jgi:hypothetical protein